MGQLVQTDVYKSTQYRGLKDYQVLIEDTSPESHFYFNISQFPDEFAYGKNGFLIRGRETLNPNSPILIEITDSNNRVIYHEVPPYKEDISRVVSVIIDEATALGLATVTILGEARLDLKGQPINEKWLGTYNVRWQKQVNVNPNIYNTNPVRFFKSPFIELNRLKDVRALAPAYKDKDGTFTFSETRLTDLTETSGFVVYNSNDGSISGTIYPDHFGRRYSVIRCDGFVFRSDMENKVLLFDEREFQLPIETINTVDTAQGPRNLRLPMQLKIENVINDTTARVSLITEEYKDFNYPIRLNQARNFFLSYLREPDYFMPTTDAGKQVTLDNSLIKIDINNLRTMTGSVLRGRLYVRNLTSDQPFEFLGDYELEPQELLVDLVSSSVPDSKRLGVFVDEIDIQNYLTLLDPNTREELGEDDIPAPFPISWDSDHLKNSIKVDARNREQPITFSFSREFVGNPLIDNSDYELSFTAVLDNDDEIHEGAKVNVYLALSSKYEAFSADESERTFSQIVPLGSLEPVGGKYGYYEVSKSFRPLRSSDSASFGEETMTPSQWTVIVEVESGCWYLSDISVKPYQIPGASPDYTRLTFPFNTDRFSNSNLRFRLDLFDINNNRVPVNIESDVNSAVDIGAISVQDTAFISDYGRYNGGNDFVLSFPPIPSNPINVYLDSRKLQPSEFDLTDNVITVHDLDFDYEPPILIATYSYYR